MVDLNVIFILLALRVLILNVEDTKDTVMASREEYLIVKGDS